MFRILVEIQLGWGKLWNSGYT